MFACNVVLARRGRTAGRIAGFDALAVAAAPPWLEIAG